MSDTTAPRIMPERWFYGETMHWMIGAVVTDHASSPRALAPGERRIGAFILPPFQRPPVWTEAQKVRLIESLYSGLPIGALAVPIERLFVLSLALDRRTNAVPIETVGHSSA